MATALVLLVGCAGSNPAPESAPITTVEEAQAEVAAFRERFGVPGPEPGPAPTTFADVVAIVRADAIHRYPAARRFMDGQTGLEALRLRTIMELTWANAFRTARDVVAERQKQLEAELAQLKLRSGAAGAERLAEVTTLVSAHDRLRQSLQLLMEPHQAACGQLAEELLRRFPRSEAGHVASLFFHRLRRSWSQYTEVNRLLDRREIDTPVVEYVRAMAEWERGQRLEACRSRLAELRAEEPDLVRVQADLVLVQDDIVSTWTELQRLKRLSPTHFMVRLVGPAIDRDYEAARALRQAR
jgi:hypothetical protein